MTDKLVSSPHKKFTNGNRRLSELVKEQLADWIMDGTLKIGQKISEEELAQQLAVSRMPVREALRVMENTGLVRSIPFVGTTIREFSQEEIKEIYMLRTLLEPTACYYAVENINVDCFYELELIQKKMSAIEKMPPSIENGKKMYWLNREFHLKIYEKAMMPTLLSIVENLWETTAYIRIKSASEPGYVQRQLEEHRLYLKFIKERDSETLRTVSAEIIEKRLEYLFSKEKQEPRACD